MHANRPSFETSPFLRRIREALDAHAPFNGRLRVSVADEPRWEKSSSGDEILVRWVCWNLEEGDQEITPPEFEVLCDTETREGLASELPEFFPEIEVMVDNDIDM